MGPQCPHCGAIYEWTCGELEEQVTAPKVYFCQECRALFILSPDEIEELQQRFRPALEEATTPTLDIELEAPDPGPAAEPEPEPVTPRAPATESPPRLRERVVLVGGPLTGVAGIVVVMDGNDVLVRLDDGQCVRVHLQDVRRS